MADIDQYPPGFPVPAEDYDDHPEKAFGIDTSPLKRTRTQVREDKLRLRELTLLYPYSLLVPKSAPDPHLTDEPVGVLRKEVVQKIEKNGTNGDWNYVEFVPPWTDPDWSDRFVFTGKAAMSDDPQVKMYVKPGILQRQRPALLPSDSAVRAPSEVAKRFGIDPTHHGDPLYGHSGVTPTTLNFEVPLVVPQKTPSNQGEKNKVDMDDLTALVTQFEKDARAQGKDTSEENFRAHLLNVARGLSSDLIKVDAPIAYALLLLMNHLSNREEQEEYQRLILAGNTSNDLVSGDVWTIGMNAVTDLATPLHELVTPDKWEVTDLRSRKHPKTGKYTRQRTVYDISGQQGEYCINNDLVRAALQPALQLVSKVLYSNHPMTWAWADIYRLRPIRDGRGPSPKHRKSQITKEHLDRGVSERDWFAVWLGDYDTQNWFPEIAELHKAGFDSVKYVCEILKRTIRWEINSAYAYINSALTEDDDRMGFTLFDPTEDPDRPFIIRIGLAADNIWPLLVKDYSEAEKAASSFTLAATMLHELAHATVCARLQMIHHSGLWLKLNPDWEKEIPDTVKKNLVTFGYRVMENTDIMDSDMEYFEAEQEEYLGGEMKNEEGFSTENQYFGGCVEPMASYHNTRFLDDLSIMGCLRLWPHDRGMNVVPRILQAVPRDLILKFFTEQFWTHDVAKWNHQAMKVWPREVPRMTVDWPDFSWEHVERKFGIPATRWLGTVHRRTKSDDDHAMLWRWLLHLTMMAVAPVILMIRWRKYHLGWKATDKELWKARNACSERAAAAQAYLQQLLDEVNAWDGTSPLPAPQIEPFRDCLNAMGSLHQDLSAEAGITQYMTIGYHVQSDEATRDTIQRLWGERLHTRLSAIHTAIANDCIQFLDGFLNIDSRVLDRLATVPKLVELLTTDRNAVRANFAAIREVYTPILRTFDQSPGNNYVFKREDFPGISSTTALDIAKRYERTAKKQLARLDGPARAVAEGWIRLLNTGDKLRNAAPGSVAALMNRELESVTDLVDSVTTAQERVVAAQYPDEAQPLETHKPLLQNNQRRPDGIERAHRFITSLPGHPPTPWQMLYAEASGFFPSKDPMTGFTLFDKVDIPTELDPDVQAAAAALCSMQGTDLAGAVGVKDPNVSGQSSGAGSAATQGLTGQAQPGGINNPEAPVAQPSDQASLQAQAVRGLQDLIQARAEQLKANPGLAGRVVPSVFNQRLQQLAGREGENLTGTNVPGDSNLFGGSTAQRSWALQQLEDLIRARAMGQDPQAPGQMPPPQAPQ